MSKGGGEQNSDSDVDVLVEFAPALAQPLASDKEAKKYQVEGVCEFLERLEIKP